MRRLVVSVAAIVVVGLGLAGPAGAWSWPTDGVVLRPFSLGPNPYAAGQHRGVDVEGATGAVSRAPVAGTVTFAGSVPTHGRTVAILTEDGYSVTLAHLGAIAVAKGESVAEGQALGTVGSSGTPEHGVPYVHLGVRVASQSEGYVDPMGFLPSRAIAPPPSPATEPAAAPEPTPAPVASDATAPATAVPDPTPVSPAAAPAPAPAEPHASPAPTPSSGPAPSPVPSSAPSPAPAPSARESGSAAPAPEAVPAAPGGPGVEARARPAVSAQVSPVGDEETRSGTSNPNAPPKPNAAGGTERLRAHDRPASVVGLFHPTWRSAATSASRPGGLGLLDGGASDSAAILGAVSSNKALVSSDQGRAGVAGTAEATPVVPRAQARSLHHGAPGSVWTSILLAVAFGVATLLLVAARAAARRLRRIDRDGAVLPHHADLLRQLDAAHRPRLHHDRRGRLRAASAPARA